MYVKNTTPLFRFEAYLHLMSQLPSLHLDPFYSCGHKQIYKRGTGYEEIHIPSPLITWTKITKERARTIDANIVLVFTCG